MSLPTNSLWYSVHIIEDETILFKLINILSNDVMRLENLGSSVNKLHERLIAFGQMPLSLNSAQISSPPLIKQTNKGFETFKDGMCSIAYWILRILSFSSFCFNNQLIVGRLKFTKK